MLASFAQTGIDLLLQEDRVLYDLLDQEYQRQQASLVMVASSSIADPSVLVCEGMVTGNTTAEGYPGARFHAGCAHVDAIEQLAIARAQVAFGAQYANVQPHSGTSANQIVFFALLKPGDTILGLDLDAGGHLTHGARASMSGQQFNAIGYGLDPDGLIDYDQVRRLARQHQPRLIICGASAYPRVIDFARFRAIADEVGAFLLADISHIAGLVAAGVHPSPINHAHFTTTSTYKQLYGPRGGLILMGTDAHSPAPVGRGTLADLIQRAVFPGFQGTPNLSAIAAKARALARVDTPEFKALAQQIVGCAQSLAAHLAERGYRVLSGGSDTHMLLIDTLSGGLTGVVAERALESCNIIVNRNKIPGETKPALVTSGLRLGTNSLALRGMGPADMSLCADLIQRVLSATTPHGDSEYVLPTDVCLAVQEQVRQLCDRFPIPRYTPAHCADETRTNHE